MSQTTIYILPCSPRSNWLAALAKSLNVEVNIVPFSESEEYFKLFPLKKTPALVDSNGFQLTEILAIVQYLLALSSDKTKAGKTIEDQAQVTRWLSFVNQDMADNWSGCIFIKKSQEEKQLSSAALVKQIKYIDDELSTRKWLAVDDYITVADEYLFSWYNAFVRAIGGVDSKNYPNLVKWHTAMIENDNVATAILK